MKFKSIYIFGLLLLLSSCKEIPFYTSHNKGVLLAKAGDNELYLEDVKGVFYAGITSADSIALLEGHVDKWVKSMLKIEKAKEQFKQENDDIERLIEQYKNTLLTNKYNNYYSTMIDTLVDAEDLVDYYDANKNSFLLASPVVKSRVLIYPKTYRGEKKLLSLVNSKKESDKYDLLDIIDKNNLRYIEYKDWTYFTRVLKDVPFKEVAFDSFLRNNTTYQISDEEYTYLMIIDGYLNSGSNTPIEMIQNVIKTSILNGRRSQVIRDMEDSLYNEALLDGTLVIKLDKEEDSLKLESNIIK